MNSVHKSFSSSANIFKNGYLFRLPFEKITKSLLRVCFISSLVDPDPSLECSSSNLQEEILESYS